MHQLILTLYRSLSLVTLISRTGNKHKTNNTIIIAFLVRFGLLTHCYDNFSKAEFAALTKKIAEAAFAGKLSCTWLSSLILNFKFT